MHVFVGILEFFLSGMDKNIKFGGTIVWGDSYLEFLFRHFKVIRLHAILHDAAGAVRAHSGIGPGYFYMIGRGSDSCLLGHVAGLLFCLNEKSFCTPSSILLTFEAVCL